MLCFEVTETAAITNLGHASYLMREMASRGCLIALDDFGSGLSSFNYLRTLPVNYLKIDGNFVQNVASDPIDRSMVEAIVQIGRAIGIETVAERVETPAVLDTLRRIGVGYAQGFLLRPPDTDGRLSPPQELKGTRPSTNMKGRVPFNRRIPLVIALHLIPLAALVGPAFAADQAHEGHAGSPMVMTGALGPYPMSRDASGTSWQPDSSPHAMGHVMHGEWMWMGHTLLNGVYDSQEGPRGDSQSFVSGMAMIAARRDTAVAMR